MEYSEDKKQIGEWIPLVMEGRDASDIVTATRMVTGTDVDYGALTKELLISLSGKEGFSVHFYSRVQDLRRHGDLWSVQIRDEKTGQQQDIQSKFVFIRAGGGALPLLQKSSIPEGHGYAGFPVSGIWLRCYQPEISSRHQAKVYGKAARGSPPMSGASSRHSAHQREGFFAFRTLCGIFHEVPQAWILSRSPAMVERARSVGIPTFENHNGCMMEGDGGASIIDLIVRDGRRHSVFRSYAFPFMDRPNLTVLTNALVTKLILERKRAAGVEIEYEGKIQRINADSNLFCLSARLTRRRHSIACCVPLSKPAAALPTYSVFAGGVLRSR